MSKKSRRRNRRLLMMAALAGSAALAGRGKGTAFPRPAAGTIDQMAADAAGTDSAVTGVKKPTAAADNAAAAAAAAAADKGSNFQSRFKAKDSGTWKGPGQILAERRLTAGNQIPPSMRGGAETAQGYVRKVPISRTGRGRGNVTYGWTTQPGAAYKKGGRVKKARVTGIAKRGFGRALMKGKK